MTTSIFDPTIVSDGSERGNGNNVISFFYYVICSSLLSIRFFLFADRVYQESYIIAIVVVPLEFSFYHHIVSASFEWICVDCDRGPAEKRENISRCMSRSRAKLLAFLLWSTIHNLYWTKHENILFACSSMFLVCHSVNTASKARRYHKKSSNYY